MDCLSRTAVVAGLSLAVLACNPESWNPGDSGARDVAAALAAQRERSAALRAQVETLQRTLEADVCRGVTDERVPAQPAGGPSGGASAPGVVPSTATAPPTSPAAAPAGVDGPADVARPTETAEESGEAPKAIPGQPAALARPLTRGQLVERLNEAVVIIIAGASTGSGFFIGPDLVVSNSHVVFAAIDIAIDDQTAAYAFIDEQKYKIIQLAPCSKPLFCQGSRIGVVIQKSRKVGFIFDNLAERSARPAREIWRRD